MPVVAVPPSHWAPSWVLGLKNGRQHRTHQARPSHNGGWRLPAYRPKPFRSEVQSTIERRSHRQSQRTLCRTHGSQQIFILDTPTYSATGEGMNSHPLGMHPRTEIDDGGELVGIRFLACGEQRVHLRDQSLDIGTLPRTLSGKHGPACPDDIAVPCPFGVPDASPALLVSVAGERSYQSGARAGGTSGSLRQLGRDNSSVETGADLLSLVTTIRTSSRGVGSGHMEVDVQEIKARHFLTAAKMAWL